MSPEFVNDKLLLDMREHALSDYPKESCGLVVDGTYYPYKNVADDPINHFKISPQAWVAASKKGEIQAVVHSHCMRAPGVEEGPDHHPYPSASDMEGQINSGLPWAIVPTNGQASFKPVWWGDFRLNEPLIGTDYIHGIADCYSVVRRWFWQVRGIKLKDQPRDYDWWHQGGDLYRQGLQVNGWRPIEESEVRVGDACLMRIRSPVLNHIALYVGNDLILQHFENRLSRREPLFPWRKYIEMWIRHESMEDYELDEERATCAFNTY